MSQAKKDQVLPHKPQVVTDDQMAKIVTMALRQDYDNMSSSIKQISRATNASIWTVKNWYEGRNAPSSGHLLLLARSSQSLLKFLLLQIGGEELWDAFRLLSVHPLAQGSDPKTLTLKAEILPNDVPINVPIKSFNGRQRWFLLQTKRKNQPRAEDIAAHFNVSVKTARRDIAHLKELGKIRFIGANKTGYYEIVEVQSHNP